MTVAIRSNSLVVSLKIGAYAIYGWSMPVRGSLLRLILLEIPCVPLIDVVFEESCYADIMGVLTVV